MTRRRGRELPFRGLPLPGMLLDFAESEMEASEMFQQKKIPATKSDHLSLISGTQRGQN